MTSKTKEFITLYSGVIISVASLLTSIVTAYLAYQIGAEQVRAAKIQYAPLFTFRKDYEKYEGGNIYKTEYLSIENEGYPILNFQAELDTVLTLTITNYSGNAESKEKSWPTDFFLGQSSSTGGKGKLAFFIGNENLSLDNGLNKQIINYNKENNFKSIINHSTKTIVKISYTDVSGDNDVKYFINEQSVTKEKYDELHSKIEGKPDLNLKDIDLQSIIPLISDDGR